VGETAVSDRPYVLGLTGSIGMGKSAVAAMFAGLGVPVFDADAAVHALQGPDGALLAAIEAEFPGTTGPAGVDRARLGAEVFDQPARLARLESIVHPAVAALRQRFLAEHGKAPLVVFDIPLLFEKGGRETVDTVLVVSAPAEAQRARVLARPGMTAERLDAIVSRQMHDAEKRARAHFVVDTSRGLEPAREQVAEIIAVMRDPQRRPGRDKSPA